MPVILPVATSDALVLAKRPTWALLLLTVLAIATLLLVIIKLRAYALAA